MDARVPKIRKGPRASCSQVALSPGGWVEKEWVENLWELSKCLNKNQRENVGTLGRVP